MSGGDDGPDERCERQTMLVDTGHAGIWIRLEGGRDVMAHLKLLRGLALGGAE